MRDPTLHEGLQALRDDRAADPAAVSAVSRLASAFGTPLYVYDKAAITGRFRTFRDAFAARFPKLRVHYALKANTNGALVALLRAEGAAAEVVSLGEILAALRAGFRGDEILFTSSSKGPDEISKAVEVGAVVNVDSRDELEQVAALADAAGRKARIAFRINPGVDPHTLHHINTGIAESKFGLHLEGGLALAAYARAQELPSVDITGVHCHLGSQITQTDGYVVTARKMLAFVRELKQALGVRLLFVDLGGGLGVPYHDGETGLAPEALAAALEPLWKGLTAGLGYEPELWMEPGRFFVAPAGFLLARVNSVKETPLKVFVNVNAGSNTLLRPAMYAAHHRARVVGRTGALETLDIAGDVCETGDILAAGRRLPRPEAGDFVVFLDAGAYGFSMASTYNARPLTAEVLVDGDTAALIRRRGTVEDLFRDEVLPPSR
ncbi:MAG: diaminopimelate decarboxylase [Thermoanaerobaculia bacterium]